VIVCHLLRRQVAVIVDDRLVLGVLVKEAPRRLGREQEVLVEDSG
jgi:hypothetical protein